MDERALFTAALKHATAAERISFLESACQDAELRTRVAELLQIHEEMDSFLEKPAISNISRFDRVAKNAVGQTIGPYRLVEQIGAGGMGVVYLAAQQQPVKRNVALKIIKPGMDTSQVIARFEAERQALALMEHPNIAKVLDAGSTESGRPFFVMELVRGIPITVYCQRESLDIRKRLQLFIDVCHAVQHAHLKGVIHRDIKPSNVMVTLHDGVPVVKMIDFGVAKAMNQPLTERTMLTSYSHFIGTPLYMSPEQADMNGLDIDTRSDIYSLGVLLYELLTNTTPFEEARLREVGYDEMRRIIRIEDPPKPSDRVSTLGEAQETVNEHRLTSVPHLQNSLSGELDWIVVRALEKSRDRRYQSAKDFADDVQRYLDGEPVEACPPSFTYRAKKLLARNKAPVLSGLAAAIVLVLATTVSTLFAVRAMQAEQDAAEARSLAETEAKIASAVTEFLSQELLGQASPYENPDRELTLREILDRASERIEHSFDGPPPVEAAIRMTLGVTYLDLGHYDSARRHLDRGLALRTKEYGKRDPATLKTAFHMAVLELKGGEAKEAAKIWERTLECQTEVLGQDHPDTLLTMDWLAYCYTLQRRFDVAEPMTKKALAGMRRVLGPDDPRTLDCLDSTAKLYQYQQRYGEAEQLQRKLLETRSRVLGEDHPQYLDSLASLAAIKLAQGDVETSIQLYGDLVEARRRVQGDDHPGTINNAKDMARALTSARQFETAEEIYAETLEAQRRRHGLDDVRTLATLESLARLYIARASFFEAETILREALDSRETEDNLTARLLRHLALLFRRQKRFDEAIAIQEQIIDLRARLFGPHHMSTELARLAVADTHQEAKRYSAAENLASEILAAAYERNGGEEDQLTLRCRMHLAENSQQRKDFPAAEKAFRELWRDSKEVWGIDKEETLEAGHHLAKTLRMLKRGKEAKEVCQQVLDRRLAVFGELRADTLASIDEMGRTCQALHQYDEAAIHFRRAIDILRKQKGDDYRETFTTLARFSRLGPKARRKGDTELAARIREQVDEVKADMEARAAAKPPHERLVALSRLKVRLNRFEDAVKHFRQLLEIAEDEHDRQVVKVAMHLYKPARDAGQFRFAERLMREVVERREQSRPGDSRRQLTAKLQLGFALRLQRRIPEATAQFNEVFEKGPATFGPADRRTLRAGRQLADLLSLTGNPEKAEPICRKVLQIRLETLGELHSDTLFTRKTLANILRRQGRIADAAEVFLRCLETSSALNGEDDPATEAYVDELAAFAEVLEVTHNWTATATIRETLAPRYLKQSGKGDPRYLENLSRLSSAYVQLKQWPDAYRIRAQEVAIRREPSVQDFPPCKSIHLLAETLVEMQRWREAEVLLYEGVDLWEQSAPGNPHKYSTYFLLAKVLANQGDFDAAERQLLRCEAAWDTVGSLGAFLHLPVLRKLFDVYEQSGQAEKASAIRRQLQQLGAKP